MFPPTRRPLGIVAATALLVSGLALSTTSPAAAAGPADPMSGARPACADALDAPTPAAEAVPELSAAEKRAVAAVNGISVATLVDQAGSAGESAASSADEGTLWLDTCGRRFYSEPDVSGRAEETLAEARSAGTLSTSDAASAAATGAGPVAPLSDTLALNSRPGANLTIFLDFDGATVSDTAWNSTYGVPAITADPYQLDGSADASFTTDELVQIQRAWAVVAEDYAPFDVNVTTQDPGADAIDRTDAADTAYGTHVLITAHGPIFDSCGCGGMAYVGVFGEYTDAATGHEYYQPAWVFTDGTSPTDGKFIAEAASHEAGHTLGLSHDGTSVSDYYNGSSPWAAIMGAGYYDPVTQWSAGEYPGANNHEDDVAIIAAHTPYVSDDHANAAAGATVLTPGTATEPATPVDGLIGTRTDVDAFTFTANGPTMRVDVTPSAVQPDLDLSATVLDAHGAVLATVDPPVVDNGRLNPAGGLDAHYALDATVGARYTVIVDGVGSGSPSTPGAYSDYGSLGRYRIAVTGADASAPTIANADGTSASVSPPTITGTTAGSLDVTPFQASGGTGPYTWTATGLPAGVSLEATTGRLTGQATSVGTWTPTVTVADAYGRTASVGFTLVVGAPDPLVLTTTALTATAGVPLEATLAASGWSGDYSYSAAGTPPWLSVAADGTLTGIPPAPGAVTFFATVTSGHGAATSTVTGIVKITVAAPVAVTSARTLKATVGQSIGLQLTATGGNGTYAWSANGLPAGLALSPSGLLSGAVSRAGTSIAVITVRSGDQTVTSALRIAIKAPAVTLPGIPHTPGPTVRKAHFPKGVRGHSYKGVLRVKDGSYAVSWSRRGRLPKGLSLHKAKHGRKLTIKGRPVRAGKYRFVLTGRDRAGGVVRRAVVITIKR